MIGFFTFILVFWLLPSADEAGYTGEYKILPQSKVFLSGTSNVNKFSCDCIHDFDHQTFNAQAVSEQELDFANTAVHLVVDYIDCKNRKMDRDLQKALKAELFPTIKIELENIKARPSIASVSWNNIKASINITLAGEKRKYEIEVKAVRKEGNILLTGDKTLNMTDFNIIPPQVLFGMIKVNDPITFHFDLLVELSSKSI